MATNIGTGYLPLSWTKRCSFVIVLFLLASALILTSAFESAANETEPLIICYNAKIPAWAFETYTVLGINEELNCILVKTAEQEETVFTESSEDVKYVEKNKLVHALSPYSPDDPFFNMQWNLNCTHVDTAWDFEKGSKNVTLAILDSGIDYEHDDLAGNYAGGFDFVNNDSDPMDDYSQWHGTMTAGVAAATIDNGIGIAGIAQVNILALKVLDKSGYGTTWNVAKAITYAANHSSDVICMSMGTDESHILEDACIYAWHKNSILVAAAGNDNLSVIRHPAVYPSVIAVGAIDENEERESHSNFGPELELVAPGTWIPTTVGNNGYTFVFSGTSAATAHVAGVAALLKSKYPEYTNEELRVRLRNTAKDLGKKGRDVYYGYGLVDAYAALDMKFDTGPGTYPCISGTHNGTIIPFQDIIIHKMFTYSCEGTGGHSEQLKIFNSTWNVTANWDGYNGDWHNITFNNEFTLKSNLTYNYSIKTGSYPQIHHAEKLKIDNGVITCEEFIDANGRTYNNWIPAIEFFYREY
ncbi:MAG: S8 family peptidase [Halobacteriota archaeon]